LLKTAYILKRYPKRCFLFFFIVFPHTSKQLWVETPSSEVGGDASVGGSDVIALRRQEWASLNGRLRGVVMFVGRIHFRDLRLGVSYWMKGFVLPRALRFARLIYQNVS